MRQIKLLLRRYAPVFGVLGLVFLPAVQQAAAAPGSIAQVPLYVGPSVEPNIVFVADDSGSMDWGVITSEPEGLFHLGGLPYYYTHPAPGNIFFWVAASEEFLQNEWGLAPADSGVWRARTHHYNRAYYSPEVTYEPWVGYDKNGVEFTNASPAAARVNPYDPAAGTVDLTDPDTSFTTDHPGVSDPSIVVTRFYPARYYTWIDTNGNGEVDVADDHELVEITNVPTDMTPAPPSSFTGGPNRVDCAAAPVCTYEEEILNFANWFSYHRNRDLIAKNAAAHALRDLTGARVGYATINNNDNVALGVASMNLSPTLGNKRTLLDRIYRTRPQGETPLRTALDRTGRYFECTTGNIFGASGASCPILPANQGGTCQKNYTVLTTDGYWNGGFGGLGSPNADGDGNTTFDGFPYADSHSNTLADVAMHYYERDLATHLENDVPVSTGDTDQARHQHMVTHTVAFGVRGSLDPATADPRATGFAWTNPYSDTAHKIDDLWHAAYNGRGEFFSAQDLSSLGAGLRAAFEAASRGRSSSASVAFNTTKLGTDSMLYQASFNPSEHWSGDLVAIGLALDGSLQSEAWSASGRLDQRLPSSRRIYTWNDDTGHAVAFRDLDDLSGRQQADLNTGPSGTSDALGQERLDYLRGDRSNEDTGLGFRVRSSILGDIVYSNPVYVGRPEMRYEDDPSHDPGDGTGTYSSFRNSNSGRTPVIYVGSNDGQLHGFRASDGEEVIAYVPNRIFSSATNEGLHYLTDPGYEHRFYVDLSPTVSDVYLNGAWRTIMIGGYRGGGRGLFALDVTDPDVFDDESAADDIVLWEFTDDDDSSIGHSFSKPTIAMMENGNWAAIFGNGYNDRGDGQAKLFILTIEAGVDGTWSASDYRVISTNVGSAGDRNGLSTPAVIDTDGNGRADRVYAGDVKGNVWAFDLSSSNQNQWKLDYKLFDAGTNQPITSKPVVARNPAVGSGTPNVLVFFGTGQYIVDGDRTSTTTQTFYGVWDDGSSNRMPRLRSSLVAQTLTADTTSELRVGTDHPVGYRNNGPHGWYFDLPTSGERVIVDPRIRGEFVFFNTLIPDPNTCNSQGYGWLMTLKLVNGGMPEHAVFDVNNDGQVNESDLVGDGKAPIGVRLDAIPAGSNFLSDLMYTPDDQGNIDIRRIDAGIAVDSGRRSWREVRQ